MPRSAQHTPGAPPVKGRQPPRGAPNHLTSEAASHVDAGAIVNARARFLSVTLRDVAQRSGVSVTTASRIINGRESGVPIRDETRERVLTAAAEMGYKPNLLARGLRGSRSSLIGVIARDVSDPFHIQVLQGINEVTRARDFRLFLGHVDYRPDVALTYGSMFERSHADGILVLGDLADGDRTFGDLTMQHRFVVGVSDRVEPGQFPGVYSDSVTGTGLALDHLWALGHRRITCVSDPGTADQRQRVSLYRTFMAEHGAGDTAISHQTSQPDPGPSYELGRRLFADPGSPAAPTAIYATSDTIAIGLMQAAYQARVVVPDQVSIVGYDNIDIAAYTIPPLTTVSQAGVEMGREAAALLLDMIEADRDVEQVRDVIIQPTLVVRESTAPPPAASVT
jgi:DNA-binding LacI/PurR family transcriptional regulator